MKQTKIDKLFRPLIKETSKD